MAETDLENQQTKAQDGKSPEASPEKNTDKSSEGKSKAMMCLVSGKRHLLVQDISSAVGSLGEACELLAQECGEKAPECAEAYFYYGKALLEAARLEAGVLGNIDTDESEEKSDEDEEEEEEQPETGDDNSDEKETNEEEEKESSEEEAKTEDKEFNAENDADAEPEKKQEEKEDIVGDAKETEDAAQQEQEDEEDPSNLQLAWEMLELAKMVLVEQLEDVKLSAEAKSALEKRLFETYLILGEVSLENENYPQAVEDLSICLQKQKAALPEDSRNIAVTYYQLGIALGFNMNYEEAIEKLEMAIGVLKKRIENLENKTESVDESKANDAFYTREKEIKEIESLIPEIKEKITDTNEMKEEALRKMAEVKEQMGFGSGSSLSGAGSSSSSTSSSSTAKPISTISIKRKAEPSTESPKKSKPDAEILKENGQNS